MLIPAEVLEQRQARVEAAAATAQRAVADVAAGLQQHKQERVVMQVCTRAGEFQRRFPPPPSKPLEKGRLFSFEYLIFLLLLEPPSKSHGVVTQVC